MMKLFRLFMLVSGLVVVLTTTAQQNKEYGEADDVAYAKALWVALEKSRLLGPNGVYSAPYTGKAPHGAFIETLTAVVELDGELLPVIVQRNYVGNRINRRAVASNPSKWMHAISVMLKREGYSPKGKDWFWARYSPEGVLLRDGDNIQQAGKMGKDKSKGCMSCHVMAPGGDMVFNHNRFSKRKSR